MYKMRFGLLYIVSAVLVVWFVGGCAENYRRAEQSEFVKRYCWMADLQEDEDLIEEYKQELRSKQWKRVCEIMKGRGVLDYEIYQFENRLLMIIETELDFNVVEFGREISGMDEVRQWAGRMNRYFQTIEGFENSGWWVFLERVYKLEQKKKYNKFGGYVVKRAGESVRRICDARELVDEPGQVAKYKGLHAMGEAWPEITQSMIDGGMIDLEIYLAGNRTFEVTEVPADADVEKMWARIDNGPRSAEWGTLMGPLDVRFIDENGRPLDNQLMERVFKLN